MDIGVRELRDGLSKRLAEVRRGRTITVTDHGHPIARIVPVGTPTRLEALRAEGRVTAGKRRKTAAPAAAISATVSDLVGDQRH